MSSDILKERIRIACPPTRNSTVDGPGIRYVVWTQGCPHHCPGCHNPQTHNQGSGSWIKVEEILDDLNSLEYHSGITLSGGEPLLQSDKILELLLHIPSHLNIWCYTGYTWEEILEDESKRKCLEYIDVLVDGKFEQERKSKKRFKGSDNQRIIDVQASLKSGSVVLWES